MSKKHFYPHGMILQVGAFSLSLVVMSALRGLFYLVNSDVYREAPLGLLETAFLNGIRFDAAISGLLILVSFLVSLPFGFFRPRLSKGLWLAIFSTGLIAIAAVSFGDIFYSQYAGKRLSYEVTVFFSSQAFPLLATAAHDFPLLFPVSSLVLAGVVYAGVKMYRALPDELFIHCFSGKYAAQSLTFLVLLLIVSRGGLQGRPLRVGDGFVTASPSVNQLVFNAPFLTMGSLQFKSSNMPQLMEPKEAYSFCRSAIESKARFVSEEYPFQRVSPDVPGARHPNVFVFMFESWSAKYLADPKYAQLTPNYHRLRDHGLNFPHAYATGTRSPNGIYSVVTGFPDFIHDTVMRRPQLASDFLSMADVFKSHGYETYFIHGGNLDFDNLEGFLRHQGFQHMYGKRDFPDVPSKVWWGVPDGAMFDLAQRVLSAAPKPYFALFFSTSTHGPYSIPDEFQPRIQVPDEHPEAAYLRALHYADYEFGQFLESMRARGDLQDAVIVVTADHSHHKGLNILQDKEIPLVFYGPSYGLNGESQRLASQIDILPTLSGILGFDQLDTALGRDLRQRPTPEHNFVYWVSGGTINLRWNDLLATQSEGDISSLRIYDVKLGFDKEEPLAAEERARVRQVLYAMYECSTRPVLDDRVFHAAIK